MMQDLPTQGFERRWRAVVIGVSAGGFEALPKVLEHFQKGMSVPVLVVQHTSPDGTAFFAQYLGGRCRITVKEAEDKEAAASDCVYIAPAGYHLLVEEDLSLSLSVDPPVGHARPSIDVLFESAAAAYGSDVIGVLLTGANADGVAGMGCIKAAGGLTVVQEPSTAASPYLPTRAIAAVAVDHVLPLTQIGEFLVRSVLSDFHGK